MMAKKSKGPREKTPLTAVELRDIARQLAYFASLYEGAADEMEKSGLSALPVKGAKNLSISLDRVNGSVQSLQSSLTETRLKPLSRTTQQAATDAADAIAAQAQRKPQRKGGSKS